MNSSHNGAAIRSAAVHSKGAWTVGIGTVFCAAAAVAVFPFFLHPSGAPAPVEVLSVPRLRESLMNLRMALETSMVDAYERGFHDVGERPPMIDIHPGIHDGMGAEPVMQPHSEPLEEPA